MLDVAVGEPRPAPGAAALGASTRLSSRATVHDVLSVGSEAPDFALPDQDGNVVRLSDQRGGWVLLWWYPKASTPG